MTPHPQAEILRAIADGEDIEAFPRGDGAFVEEEQIPELTKAILAIEEHTAQL